MTGARGDAGKEQADGGGQGAAGAQGGDDADEGGNEDAHDAVAAQGRLQLDGDLVGTDIACQQHADDEIGEDVPQFGQDAVLVGQEVPHLSPEQKRERTGRLDSFSPMTARPVDPHVPDDEGEGYDNHA